MRLVPIPTCLTLNPRGAENETSRLTRAPANIARIVSDGGNHANDEANDNHAPSRHLFQTNPIPVLTVQVAKEGAAAEATTTTASTAYPFSVLLPGITTTTSTVYQISASVYDNTIVNIIAIEVAATVSTRSSDTRSAKILNGGHATATTLVIDMVSTGNNSRNIVATTNMHTSWHVP
eukprot:3875576-Pyramimonas_sp.AAC.1